MTRSYSVTKSAFAAAAITAAGLDSMMKLSAGVSRLITSLSSPSALCRFFSKPSASCMSFFLCSAVIFFMNPNPFVFSSGK